MGERVAWVVDADEESTVLYEQSEARARVRYARRHGLDAEDVKARREPALDEYSPGPVPAAALLDVGWWLECSECYHHVTSDGCCSCMEDGDDTGEPPAHVTEGTAAWCSAECRSATEARWREEARAKAATQAAVPDCEVTGTWRRSPASDGWASTVKVPGARREVTYYWPSGVVMAYPCDVAAVRFALGRDALPSWESEGGRP